MKANEIFVSSLRSSGDLAGVFEYDGECGYFYLYSAGTQEGQKILDTLHILSGEPDFGEGDVEIRWDAAEEKVGILIRRALCAVFDVRRGLKYGGNYQLGAIASLPSEALAGFEL